MTTRPMHKIVLAITTLGLVGALSAGPALGASLSLDPPALIVSPGTSFDLDVVISDLAGDLVSGFDLNLAYDAAVLDLVGVTFGALLGDPVLDAITEVLPSPGLVNFVELSLLSDADLAALQPAGFVLATLTFDVIGPGSSTLTFVPGAAGSIEVLGAEATSLDLTVGSGSVESLPEPGSWMLCAGGVLAVAALRRRLSRRTAA